MTGVIEALKSGKEEDHARKYQNELRERAARILMEARQHSGARSGASARVSDQLGSYCETLRNWVSQAEVDGGHRSGTSTGQAQRLAELEREIRELHRTTTILKSASVSFAAELEHPHTR